MSNQHLVAVVGAGPAGLYGARKLTEAGHRVVLINRDIKPGGLAEYGIFVDKEKMKTGLRKQFKRILADPKVFYLGHVMVGQNQALSLDDLRAMGFSAVVVTAGAQGTKKLGIEGEEAVGVYHAKDVVYHFNSLPPFAERQFEIGRRVAIIGMGNVMVDIANWLLNLKKIDQVIVVARRGPLEKAYDDSEFEYIDMYLDNADMKQEIERISGSLTAVGQDVGAIMKKMVRQGEPLEGRRLTFRYLCSPNKVVANAQGRVAVLEAEENEMVLQDGKTVAKGTGKTRRIEVDCVIYAIGDQVDASLGLPFSRGAFVTNPEKLPGDPNPAAYQPYDPEKKTDPRRHLRRRLVAQRQRRSRRRRQTRRRARHESGQRLSRRQTRSFRRRYGSENRGFDRCLETKGRDGGDQTGRRTPRRRRTRSRQSAQDLGFQIHQR